MYNEKRGEFDIGEMLCSYLFYIFVMNSHLFFLKYFFQEIHIPILLKKYFQNVDGGICTTIICCVWTNIIYLGDKYGRKSNDNFCRSIGICD